MFQRRLEVQHVKKISLITLYTLTFPFALLVLLSARELSFLSTEGLLSESLLAEVGVIFLSLVVWALKLPLLPPA